MERRRVGEGRAIRRRARAVITGLDEKARRSQRLLRFGWGGYDNYGPADSMDRGRC